MKNLKTLEISELNDSELNETTGGIIGMALLPLIVILGCWYVMGMEMRIA